MKRRAFLRNGLWLLGAPYIVRAQVKLGISKVGQSAGAVTTALCSPNVLSQDWESGSLPSGWTTFQGTPTYNYATAPAPLKGSFSLGLPANATQAITKTAGLAQAEMWGFFYFETAALTASASTNFVELFDVSSNHLLTWIQDASGALRLQDNVNTVAFTNSMSASTLYYCWFHYKAGSGANAVIEASFSSSLSRPTSGNQYQTITGGSNTTNVDSLFLVGPPADANSPTFVYDHLGLSNTCSFDNGW